MRNNVFCVLNFVCLILHLSTCQLDTSNYQEDTTFGYGYTSDVIFEDAITAAEMVSAAEPVQPISPISQPHICHAQCLAMCTDSERLLLDGVNTMPPDAHYWEFRQWDVSEDCEQDCEKFETDRWIVECQGASTLETISSYDDCLYSCHDLHNDSTTEIDAPPEKPFNVSLRQIDPYTVQLKWMHRRNNLHSVLFVIEGRTINHNSGNKLYPWQVIHQTVDLDADFRLDVCAFHEYRIASVNQFGCDGFTNETQRIQLPVPGPVADFKEEMPPYVQYEYTAGQTNAFFVYTYRFSPPQYWHGSDVKYQLVSKPAICDIAPRPLPDSVIIQEENSSDHILTIEIHYLGAYCIYPFQLIPQSVPCKSLGTPYNFTINLREDCRDIVSNVTCAAPRRPSDVRNVTITLNNVTMEVSVTWIEPSNLGSFTAIQYYIVQWGFIQYETIMFDKKFPKKDLDEEGRIQIEDDNETLVYSTSFHILENDQEYGVKVVPIASEIATENDTIEEWIHQADIHVVGTVQSPPGIDRELTTYSTSDIFTFPNNVVTPSYSSTTPFNNASFPGFLGESTNPNSDNRILAYILAPIGVMLIIALISVTWYRKRNPPMKKGDINHIEAQLNDSSHFGDTKLEKQITNILMPNPLYKSAGLTPKAPDRWEIDRNYLILGGSLGRGAFGQVLQGTLKTEGIRNLRKVSSSSLSTSTEDSNPEEITVAVKLLLDYADDSHRQDFLKEIELMKSIGYHCNVVSMIGCCTRTAPLALIVEHLPNGDLLHFLRKHRHYIQQGKKSPGCGEELTLLDLLAIARQISVGMEFLSQRGFVHRDLACRNVLVGENKTVKIGDFGLTRYIYDDKIYVTRKGGKLPLKWMAIEAIFDLTFTSASDVWSFGVVLFELVTLGGTPYPTIANRDLLLELHRGYRMERPDNCTSELYDLMLDCWKTLTDDRPTFTQIRDRLDTLVESYSTVDYMTFDLDQNKDYYCAGNEASNEGSNESVFNHSLRDKRRASLSTKRKFNEEVFGSSPESGVGIMDEKQGKWTKLKPLRRTGYGNDDNRNDTLHPPLSRQKMTSFGAAHQPLRVLCRSHDDLIMTSASSTAELLSRSSLSVSTSDPGYETQKSWLALNNSISGETKL